MKIDSRSLGYRLFVPILTTIAIITFTLLILINYITHRILDDYHRFIVSGHNEEIRSLLDSSIAELTMAKLLDKPALVEAKQKSLVEAISLKWQRREIGGLIVDQKGNTIVSSFSPALTAEISKTTSNGFINIDSSQGRLYGQASIFHPWDWRVITIVRSESSKLINKVYYLVPLVAVGSLTMLAALLFLLRKKLQNPLTTMVNAVRKEEAVSKTGISEFDDIGQAINDAMNRVAERTTDLAVELAERKRAEAVVREREARIRLLLNSTAEGIFGVNTDDICTFCNPACCRLLGYNQEDDLLGKKIHDLIHHSYPDGRPYPLEECRVYEVCRTGHGTHVNNEVFFKADGSSLPVEYWSYPLSEAGTVRGAVVTFIDITERKQAEEALRSEKNKFEAIIAALGDGLSILDRDYKILFQNEVHKNFFGDHTGEICFKAFEQKENRCPGCPVALAFDDGGIHSKGKSYKSPEGVRHFEKTVSPLRDASGTIVAGIEVVRDITERQRAEEQLRQAQKMESIGHLAGGVAHDFNNVLTVVQGYAELLHHEIPASFSLLHNYVDEIAAASQHGSAITRQILAFSRKETITIQSVNLNDLVFAIEKMLRRLVREDIDIQINIGKKPLVIKADPGQIDQILINLTTNARDAMPEGGVLHIAVEQISLDQEFTLIHGYGMPGDYALLIISDTGSGMDETVQKQIFDPFFTTKEVGKGTGLGLSMVYGIVKKHGGYINVYSERDVGTVFKIYLPLADDSSQQGIIQGSPNSGELLGGTETILVVEDNSSLRLLLMTILERAGYTVIEAVDGEEAVKKYTQLKDSIHLAMLDGIMPRKNGKQALLEMRALNPYLKAIIVSGYAEEIFSRNDLTELQVTFIAKPIVRKEILQKIREVLDSSESIAQKT
ncbi:MAG: hypothetical protein A2511_09335 [Deltaproteobacteria bacterium RIFOXYD12_FULL_50_9]|nr:MAG: hypothetical protein A2511_09335 [Deltaproteobacteria bacterium RIFOXYD12_FULL_50_9]